MTEAEYKDQHHEFDEYESEICHDCSLCRHKKTDGIMIRCPYDESPRNPDCGFELMKPTLAEAVSEVEDLNIDYGNRTQEEVDYVDACIDTLIEFAKRSIERKEADGWNVIHSKEDLPKESGKCLVSLDFGDVSIDYYDKDWGFVCYVGNVIAWKPLPKPYIEPLPDYADEYIREKLEESEKGGAE